jgi:hypothetical protein
MTQTTTNPSPILSLFSDFELSPKARKIERPSSQRRIAAIREKYDLLRKKKFSFIEGKLVEDDKNGTIKLSFKDVVRTIANETFCEPSLVEKVISGYYGY